MFEAGPRYCWAFVFFIGYSISICIHQRTTIIVFAAREGRTFIFFIIYSIPVGIRNGATSIFLFASNIRASVIFIDDAITITIGRRASIVFSEPCNIRASVYFIRNTITVCIRATACGECSGFCRTGIIPVYDSIIVFVFWLALEDGWFAEPEAKRGAHYLVIELTIVRSSIEIVAVPG